MAQGHVLVTGASGFVGSALVRRLIHDQCLVRAARRNPEADVSGAEVVAVGDLSGKTDWTHALRGVALVIHCAARAHVLRETVADPAAEFRRVNTDATLRLAQQAAERGVQRLVFVSSIGVNGAETHERPFSETDPPAPHSPYADSKYRAEVGLRALAAKTGMQLVVVRPPLVYGRGARGNWARLMRCLRAGIPLPFGALNNRRSFIGLDNLVDVLVACAFRPAAESELYLVSDGEDVSTTELLRRMAAALDVPARLFPVPSAWLRAGAELLGQGEAAQRLFGSLQIDSSRIRERLGWRPPLSLDEGLRRAAGHIDGQAIV